MLKARLDSIRKNKKGFSLVELIIVIAIMVALIAVMAPSFIKYVQKSRDAALATAAEDFAEFVKTEIGAGSVEIADCTITITVADGKINIAGSPTLSNFADDAGYSNWATFQQAAGVDSNKKMGASKDSYDIKVTSGKVTVEFTDGDA